MKDVLGILFSILLIVGIILGCACFSGWLFMLFWNKVLIGLLGLGLPKISFWLATGVFFLIETLFRPHTTVNVKSKG